MYTPDKERFIELAKRGNLVPVYREFMADMETPVSAFAKLDEMEQRYAGRFVEMARWHRQLLGERGHELAEE